MGALETVGAGIAGVAAARMILGSPKAAAGAAIASTTTAAQSLKSVGVVAAAGVGGAALGSLAGVAALAGAKNDGEPGFDFGLDDRREQIGWGAAIVTATAIGAAVSSSSLTARIAGGVVAGSFVAAGAAVTNFTRDEMPPVPKPAAEPAPAQPVHRDFERNADLAGAVVGRVGATYDEGSRELRGRSTWFDGGRMSGVSFGSRAAALEFVDRREQQLAKGGALVHRSFDVQGNWSVTYLDDDGSRASKRPPNFWEHDAAGLRIESDSVLVLPDGTRIESK